MLISDRVGQKRPKKRVTYVSCVFIEPSLFFAQVEPGETFATTKEGEYIFTLRI